MRVLVVSQVMPQAYFDMLLMAFGEDTIVDIITGSDVRGANVVFQSPKHNPISLKGRLNSWIKHKKYIDRWLKNNDAIYDLIFATSNPPINAYIGLKLKKRIKCPFIYMNWDLYPQVISCTFSNFAVLFICRLWSKWNNKNYPKIDKILTLGEVIANSIKAECSNANIQVIPLPVDINCLKPIKKTENRFSVQYGLVDKCVVLYSGKMGAGHNIKVILDAASILKENYQIAFVFIGNGEKYDGVKEFIENNPDVNVKLLPFQDDDVFPFSIACGDIGIVSQEAKMAHLFMPSKTYSMMACGEAIIGICSDNDDLRNLILGNRIGEVITDGNPVHLAQMIERMSRDNNLMNQYKINARNTAEGFSIETIAKKYNNLFDEVMNKNA